MNISEIKEELKNILTEKRYDHTLGVAYTAACLAIVYGEDMEKAELAGLLHDNAKCFSDDKLLKKCKKYNVKISDAEMRMPYLLHAKLGAYYAVEKYGASDEIAEAVSYHTTGRPDMSMLEKIVYVADYIEPNRNKAKRLHEIRKTAFEDIDMCVYMIASDAMEYLGTDPEKMDEMTEKTYLYYKKLIEAKKEAK